MKDELNLLTEAVIGCAIDAHRELGPGLKESFYQRRMSSKLRGRGIEHVGKPRRQLIHRGHLADEFEVDFLFGPKLLADLKVPVLRCRASGSGDLLPKVLGHQRRATARFRQGTTLSETGNL
jgi:hypothetical protein